jgi:hypothetical protein
MIEMSVVVYAPAGLAPLARTLDHLQAQEVRDRLEIVIVTPDAAAFQFDPAQASCFAAVQIVEPDPSHGDEGARAAGVWRARGPVVAFAEEHSYAEPGWAQALIARHREPWAAVGPAIVLANPETAISCANCFLDFGRFVAPARSEAVHHLASHNSSYKREYLLSYGPRLSQMLTSEEVLFADLRSRGLQLFLEGAARVRHVNISLPAAFLKAEFLGGRLFGALRAQRERWPGWRRALHLLAGPPIAVARLRHVLRDIFRSNHQREALPRALPALLAGLWLHGAGEAVGCLLGPGQAAQARATFENERWLHLNRRDRARFGQL